MEHHCNNQEGILEICRRSDKALPELSNLLVPDAIAKSLNLLTVFVCKESLHQDACEISYRDKEDEYQCMAFKSSVLEEMV